MYTRSWLDSNIRHYTAEKPIMGQHSEAGKERARDREKTYKKGKETCAGIDMRADALKRLLYVVENLLKSIYKNTHCFGVVGVDQHKHTYSIWTQD